MKIKKYTNYINEDLKSDLSPSFKENKDLKEAIIDIVIKSLNTEDKKTISDFLSSYVKDQDSNQIVGLINDSDIYDFYISYRNDIDQLLSDISFYDEVPSEIGSFSLYDYVVKGTKKAILDLVTSMKSEIV